MPGPTSPKLGLNLPDTPAFASPPSTQLPTMSTLSVVDLQDLVKFLCKNPIPSTKLVPPRIGETKSTGAWTGFGTDGLCGAARSSNCVRAFLADPLKSHTAMANIESKCVSGLSDQSDLLFCMKDEPNAHKFVASIRAFEEAVSFVGMEAAFIIVRPDRSNLNMAGGMWGYLGPYTDVTPRQAIGRS